MARAGTCWGSGTYRPVAEWGRLSSLPRSRVLLQAATSALWISTQVFTLPTKRASLLHREDFSIPFPICFSLTKSQQRLRGHIYHAMLKRKKSQPVRFSHALKVASSPSKKIFFLLILGITRLHLHCGFSFCSKPVISLIPHGNQFCSAFFFFF